MAFHAVHVELNSHLVSHHPDAHGVLVLVFTRYPILSHARYESFSKTGWTDISADLRNLSVSAEFFLVKCKMIQ